MKITLVYSRMLVNTSHPIGLLSIAAYLEREGHEVKVIDPSLNDSDKIIVQSILRDNPDIVGFTAVTLEFNKAMRIATELKKHSDVPVVIGGVHATILPEEVARYDCFDYIVVGEGEETVSELLDAKEVIIDENNKLSPKIELLQSSSNQKIIDITRAAANDRRYGGIKKAA